ncbi:MAG: GDSL-type esterase/lipase family protein [Oscillospiraceae bacterium]|nr:GDSL-type esterase/lipase family protein [Oscillospiraceae bacterium]
MRSSAKCITFLALALVLALALSGLGFASGEAGHPEYAAENETAQKGAIVMTGSSLCEQFPISEIIAERGDSYVIYNRGYGGYTMTQLMEVLDTAVIDLEPSALFINIGTNDIDRLSETYTIEDMMDNYAAILTTIQEAVPDCAIYIMAYYPCTPNTGEGQIQRTLEQIEEVNSYLPALAEEAGATFIDVNEVLRGEDGYLKDEYAADSIHLTDEAYEAIYDALVPYFDECVASESYLGGTAVEYGYEVELVRDDTATLDITVGSGQTVDVELLYAGMDTTRDFSVVSISDECVTASASGLNATITGAYAGESVVTLSWTAVNTSGSTYTVEIHVTVTDDGVVTPPVKGSTAETTETQADAAADTGSEASGEVGALGGGRGQGMEEGGILFCGSSLMGGFDVGTYLAEDGYDISTGNMSMGGTIIADFAAACQEQIVALNPGAIFINIGSVDTDRIRDGIFDMDYMMDSYEALLIYLQEELPDCEIYVMAYYPATENSQRDNSIVDEANEKTEALAGELGVNFVDITYVLKNEDGYLISDYSADGIHLTDEAYRLVYGELKAYILESVGIAITD